MSDEGYGDEVCITCSDQLLEVVVTSVAADGATARGLCDGAPCEVSIDLVEDVEVGDHLLAHGGVALQRGRLQVTL